MDSYAHIDNGAREGKGKSREQDIDISREHERKSRGRETKRSKEDKDKLHGHDAGSTKRKQNKLPEQVKPDQHPHSFAERMTESGTNDSPHRALTGTNVTTTPTLGISDVHNVDNLHLFDTSAARVQHRSRSHRSSSSSITVKLTSSKAGKAPKRRSSSSSSDNDDYGEDIAPRLDLGALSRLPPRLQKSMLAMQRERDLRVAPQAERLPLPTPQRTTPLGSHPPTDDERAYARGLTQRYREAAPPPSGLRTGPQLNRTIAPFMEHEGRSLSETEPVPPSARRRMLKKSKSLLVVEKLASAKKLFFSLSPSCLIELYRYPIPCLLQSPSAPTIIHSQNAGPGGDTQSGDRQVGRKAQLSNITAAKTVADIIRSCLGPKAMLKMLLDPMGGIVLTNDGHAILREIEVAHPAAKSMIELSRTQDEEVGDGTTTVIILAGEILAQALPQLERNIHPVVIISAYKRALADALDIVEEISLPVNINDDKAMYRLISSSIGTKFVSRWSELMCNLALKAVRTVSHDLGGGKKEVDIKRYAKVEKIPGGEIEDSRVLDGVMLNKDITHPKMRRRIENPRVILLDCPLEYKKGESQTNIEISKEEDWNRILQIEEEQVKHMTDAILALKPDLVITEKGVSDLAQHFLVKNNVTALRRVRKTDNNRIARATGATIVNRVDDLNESDVGTQCGLFEIEKIGDEYFTFITKCRTPKACTILLRGPSKDILNEIERNLQDAMSVAKNVIFHPRLSPGGGATEMAVSVQLAQKAKGVEGVQQWPYRAVAEAMEVIPRTLIQNSGSSPIRVLTRLRAKHAEGHSTWGIDGDKGTLVDMNEYGVWEPEAVKLQSIKTAIESACLLLRVDDICSAKSAKQSGTNMGGGGED
ncbi:T-complex protein 1 subunit gamma [Lobaria immixta]|nr:T-complex protein 1 subunit gamma [Lobaria immixta]